MFQAQLDRLIAFVSTPEFSDELVLGKKEYFAKTGEVFETDESFEARMALFLDWFLFDRVLAQGNVTPSELFVERHGATLTPDELVAHRNFAHTIHSLFEVGRFKPETVDMKDLFAGKTYAVYERRKPVGVEPGDIIEARLFMTEDNRLMFSPAFCFHPREAKKSILKMLKAHKKTGLPARDFVFRMAYLRLKVERYKHVTADKIYQER